MTKQKQPEQSMDAFFTTDKAEEGIKIPLVTPEGTPTDHWIRIRGVDSEHFREAEARCKRKLVEYLTNEKLKDKQKEEKRITEERVLTAALVKEWSFDEECTHTNVVKFFNKAPQIQEMVNKVSANRTFFFREVAGSSLFGSSKKNA